MMSQRQFLWCLCTSLFLGWGAHFVYHHKALGFTINKITSDFPDDPTFVTEQEEQKVLPLLSQPFHYLAAGSQSYAFVSEDGQTVIKFFRMKHKILHLRDLWRGNRTELRKQNLFSIYAAHHLAYRKMKEEAGLIYLHLNKTNHLPKLTLIDVLHRKHVVDLNQVEFVLQEKAELILTRFKQLLNRNDMEGFKEARAQVIRLVEHRSQKGISDHDKAISHNFGFVGKKAIQLDVGRLYLGTTLNEGKRVFDRIQKWYLQQKKSRFSLDQVTSNLPAQPKWTIPSPSVDEAAKLRAILSQKFTFLGEGAQAYAFVSEDERYVLKLFKMRRFTPSFFDHLCPHVVRRRLRNLHWVFNGYTYAYNDLRKECGLVWIHLAKTHDFHHCTTLIDPSGTSHLLDIDSTEFVLQEKAELVFTHLHKLYDQGKQTEAEAAIAALLQLIQTRIDKGYADRDKAVSYNYGFVQGRPIQLDVGRLYKGHQEGQLEHVQHRIEKWKLDL